MSETKPKQKTKVGKLTYHEGAGSYLLVIPIEFVKQAHLEDSYIKITLLEDGNLLLKKLEL